PDWPFLFPWWPLCPGEGPGGSRTRAGPGRGAAQSAGCEPGRQLHRRHDRRAWASRNCSAGAGPGYRVGQFGSSNARRAASIARRISAAEASAASPVTSSVAATFGPSSRSRTGRVGHRRAFATLGQPSLLLKFEGTAVAVASIDRAGSGSVGHRTKIRVAFIENKILWDGEQTFPGFFFKERPRRSHSPAPPTFPYP